MKYGMKGPLAIVAAVMEKYWMPVVVAMTVPFSGGFVGEVQAEAASARSKRVTMELEFYSCTAVSCQARKFSELPTNHDDGEQQLHIDQQEGRHVLLWRKPSRGQGAEYRDGEQAVA